MPTTADPLRRTVRLMLANLAAAVVVAAVTVLTHDAILADQLAALPVVDPATRASMSVTLWTRPIPVLAVAVVYPLLVRRLRAGRTGAWRRLVIVAVLQLCGLTWLALTQHQPGWLQLLEAGQAAVVVALLVAATRPAVRAPVPPATGRRPGPAAAAAAAAALVVLAPLIAEVAWGSTRLSQIWVLPLYWPLYGAGGAAGPRGGPPTRPRMAHDPAPRGGLRPRRGGPGPAVVDEPDAVPRHGRARPPRGRRQTSPTR